MGIFESKQNLNVVTCGLDNSGKSTIINGLKPTSSRTETISATIGYQVEEFEKERVAFKVFDMGGAKKFRALWEMYFKEANAVIFVIDASDKLRLVLVKDELKMLVQHPDLRKRPILLFANKSDVAGAKTPQELVEELELPEMLCDREYNIFASDARRGVGIEEGLSWLTSRLVK
jgi:ADP-ribosylation factor-like protein 6